MGCNFSSLDAPHRMCPWKSVVLCLANLRRTCYNLIMPFRSLITHTLGSCPSAAAISLLCLVTAAALAAPRTPAALTGAAPRDVIAVTSLSMTPRRIVLRGPYMETHLLVDGRDTVTNESFVCFD